MSMTFLVEHSTRKVRDFTKMPGFKRNVTDATGVAEETTKLLLVPKAAKTDHHEKATTEKEMSKSQKTATTNFVNADETARRGEDHA